MLALRFPAPDMEYVKPVHGFLALQSVTVLAQKMRNIYDTERIGAFNGETAALRELPQRFARPQHRQRAVQAAQIENGNGSVFHGQDLPG
jgi:hypothetical protein